MFDRPPHGASLAACPGGTRAHNLLNG
jgi:hypothetical protein